MVENFSKLFVCCNLKLYNRLHEINIFQLFLQINKHQLNLSNKIIILKQANKNALAVLQWTIKIFP